jgi:hypothetical protein
MHKASEHDDVTAGPEAVRNVMLGHVQHETECKSRQRSCQL